MFRSRKRSFVAFLTPALLMIICIQFLPMAYNVVLSFLNIQLNKPNLSVEFVGFDNYASILTDSGFWNSVIVTLIIGISSTVLQLVLGLTLALLLDIKGRFGKAPAGMGFFRGLLFIPYMIMPIMVGLMWFIFADSNYGMLNPILQAFGIPTRVWFSDPNTAIWAIVAMDTWQCTPMVMMILSSGLKTIDGALYEAAVVDGANAWQKFRSITIPLLKPVLKVAVSMRLMDVMRIYDTIIATTKGGPGEMTEAISVFTQKLGFEQFKTSMGGTTALLITILILAMSELVVRVFSTKNDEL